LNDSHGLIQLLVNRNVLVLGKELLARTPHGYVLVPVDDLGLVSVVAEGWECENATSRILDLLLKEGVTFVDIGANIGIHTVHAARRVGQTGNVFAFEPRPQNFDLLQKSIHVNGLTNVCKCMNFAIAAAEGSATLHLSDICGHNSLFPLVDERTKTKAEVKTVPLDKVIPVDERFRVVKIDAEGAELEVLAGMEQTVKNCREIVLIVEFGVPHLERNGVTSAEWFDRFFAHGFDVFALDEQAASWRQVAKENALQLPSTNLVFVRPETEPWILLKQHET
jgi:FkbM family methyltransferase